MSYLVLARKWRPRSFETLIGQDHVVRALTHALSTGRLHHAWLFTGTRGVGKTTLSRILAKSLNCEQGVTASPCGHCSACTEIDAGRFVDYIELDAASNRGVDEMTQLLEQAVYAPSSGRYKVYMIDEVHMLTGHAFNAMLKTLEEPPAHVKFILATTDPQKIPVTVLSRCLQFNLKQMTVAAMVAHLEHVLAQESFACESHALRLIAQAASGSMRDALSLTDQAISYSAGNLTAQAVQEMLGTLDQHHLLNLLRALTAGDAGAVLAVADDLAARGLSYQAALADLAVLLSRIAIAQRLGAAQADDPMSSDIEALAQTLQPDELQLFYSVAVHSRHELSLAPDEYAGFVMACLRMLALLPADRIVPPALPSQARAPAPAESDAQFETLVPSVATTKTQEPAPQPAPEPSPPVAASAFDDGPPAWEDEGTESLDEPEPEMVAVDELDEALVASAVRRPPPVAAALPRPEAIRSQDWPSLAASLPLSGTAAELALNSEWISGRGNEVRIRVAIRSFAEGGGRDRLCTVLSEYFGQVIHLVVECGGTGEDTAYAVEQTVLAARQQAAEQAVSGDVVVQRLLQDFDARVLPGSIRPPAV
ncbi:DNA polymerase III subunit gamma/tau [Alcaligenaceae bacterium CGII-47]|nr:DNA polymerase III subunit gamma/tau [Alcaligenaceae bacterium CGII-47]